MKGTPYSAIEGWRSGDNAEIVDEIVVIEQQEMILALYLILWCLRDNVFESLFILNFGRAYQTIDKMIVYRFAIAHDTFKHIFVITRNEGIGT